MPRYKLVIEYAGTKYSGWQIQKNARTVQGEIDQAVRRITSRRDFELYGSGRTDAGVHALGQVAHLDVSSSLPPDTLRERLNGELPADINVLAAAVVPHRFHARHDAVARRYVYQVALRRTAFAKPFVWWVKEPLDVARMRQAATAFVGMHDFTAFANIGRGSRAELESNDDHEPSSRVLIERLDIEPQGDLVLIGVEGSHFLWRMVRRMVGVLVEIGRGGIAPSAAGRPSSPFDAAAGLLASPSDLPARLTAPASGLFLDRVYYKGDSRDVPLAAATPLAVSRPSVVPSTRRTTSA